MVFDPNTKVLIVGLGLIGGSYAQGLSALGCEVGAIDPNAASIEFAVRNGMIRDGRTEPDATFVSRFDLVVFALYPHTFLEWLEKYQHMLRPGALLTDTTGIKGGIVHRIQEMLRNDLEFIGAHPMAGREVSGVENASREIFRGANYIVTPTEKNSPEAVERCKALGRALGFGNVSILSPEAHDEMIAFLSQLTHCIAVALMTCRDSGGLIEYTGDSFRDLTRIAKINDRMWSELFLLNREPLLREMDLFAAEFRRLRSAVAGGDTETIRSMMRLSTQRRKDFDHKEENV